MPTALIHPAPTLKRGVDPPPISPRHAWTHWWFVLALVLVLALLIGAASWVFFGRGASTTPQAETTTPAATMPIAGVLLIDPIANLGRQLRTAGYALPAIKVDYSLPAAYWLDPLTRSAAADYLRISETSPLDPRLASALQGTVITGRRDPAVWSARFGTNRVTRWVERPLTGPGGQLDAFGNLTG
jgi:hypothetical protein